MLKWKFSFSSQHMNFCKEKKPKQTKKLLQRKTALTQHGQHARGPRRPHFAGVLCFVGQQTLVDDENAHCSLRYDVVFFALFDFSTVFEPLNLYLR